MMGEAGIEGIGIRELARRLDYSPAALYRYFESREQIVATLSADSMTLLATRLKAAAHEAGADPLVSLGEAYLRFARDEPVRFRLLFVALLSTRRSLQTRPRPESPYRIVLDTAKAVIAAGRISGELNAESVAFTLWSLVHGMAVLESTHLRGFRADFEPAHRLALQHLVNSWRPSNQPRTKK